MIAASVPRLADFDPGDLAAAHLLEADVQEGVVLRIVDCVHVDNFAPLVEVHELSIAEPCLVLVVDDITGLR